MKEKNAVLTLNDGKKYVIVKDLLYNEKEYFYLIDIEDKDHQILCEVEGTKIRTIVDPYQIQDIVLNASEK